MRARRARTLRPSWIIVAPAGRGSGTDRPEEASAALGDDGDRHGEQREGA